ncbi:hypothetical protein PVK06_002851 [Gossypium arboreum]|uniref:Uncharacterized protein n=1 Tax=Gossypium arboreum TaxID=29729 RepID=A0ABR0R5U3_GOSAR|nr:hypothetical protein PVK06_002851 [Gossypium arboreum]
MFESLNERCGKELEAVERQYPFEPLKLLLSLFFLDPYTLQLTFEEGVQMLKLILKLFSYLYLKEIGQINEVSRKEYKEAKEVACLSYAWKDFS